MSTVFATITPIATSVIAGCALVLTFRSGQDNRDKLRLDLFNRRFSIYQRTLVFYQALIVWKDTDEQKALIPAFIEASREALFIFPRKSGVYEHLQRIWDHSWKITQHQEVMSGFAPAALYGDEETKRVLRKVVDERSESAKWILSSMTELESLMKKSMSFERL
jgi:hypothetical protein